MEIIIFLVLASVGFLAYIIAMVNAAKTEKWLWFVLMLFVWPLFVLYLLLAYGSPSDSDNSDSSA